MSVAGHADSLLLAQGRSINARAGVDERQE